MDNTKIRFIEIPVVDLTRASQFYRSVFKFEFHNMEMGNAKLAMFFIDEDQTNGALVQGDGYVPSKKGALIYFSSSNIDVALENISRLGGTVTMPKSSLEGHGFTARFIDTEGNKIGLHSQT